jgi:hypothetical protein
MKRNIEEICKNKERRFSTNLLRFDKDVKINDLTDIIYNLYSVHHSRMYDILYYQGKLITYNVKTGKKSGNFHRRSCEDLFRISKHYFPKITYIEVYNIFKKLEKNRLILTDHCYTCGKRVGWCCVMFTKEKINESLK